LGFGRRQHAQIIAGSQPNKLKAPSVFHNVQPFK
jgi:hypothetical protein